jgi:hypothetical protein
VRAAGGGHEIRPRTTQIKAEGDLGAMLGGTWLRSVPLESSKLAQRQRRKDADGAPNLATLSLVRAVSTRSPGAFSSDRMRFSREQLSAFQLTPSSNGRCS